MNRKFYKWSKNCQIFGIDCVQVENQQFLYLKFCIKTVNATNSSSISNCSRNIISFIFSYILPFKIFYDFSISL